MAYFLVKLLPPRPTFMADMTPEELGVMQAHGAYWNGMAQQGFVLAFGPVADPAGAWGMGLMQVESTAQLDALLAQDPAVTSGRGFRTEYHPMPLLTLAPQPAPIV